MNELNNLNELYLQSAQENQDNVLINDSNANDIPVVFEIVTAQAVTS